ncbi:uncharacterized protein LOC143830184 [Paroedura picta]|uniref:uncharacterized protein LOC143830184 n=1 Tax=Paroedura picta TaxID=143630 RepID=UPI0040572333
MESTEKDRAGDMWTGVGVELGRSAAASGDGMAIQKDRANAKGSTYQWVEENDRRTDVCKCRRRTGLIEIEGNPLSRMATAAQRNQVERRLHNAKRSRLQSLIRPPWSQGVIPRRGLTEVRTGRKIEP